MARPVLSTASERAELEDHRAHTCGNVHNVGGSVTDMTAEM